MALHLELVLEILGFFCLVDLSLAGLIFLCVCARPWDGFLVPYILFESVQCALRVGSEPKLDAPLTWRLGQPLGLSMLALVVGLL